MLTISREIEERNWDRFTVGNKGNLLQSFGWGEFQKLIGKSIWRFIFLENSKIIAQAQAIKEIFPFRGKSFLYIPYGPVFKIGISRQKQEMVLKLILNETKALARKENVIFLKIEPLLKLFPLKGFLDTPSVKRFQPKETLILAINKTEEEIFKGFTYRVRYNIKLSSKKGVKIKIRDKYIPEFYNLMEQTATRNKFRPFRETYYQKLLDFPKTSFQTKLFLAEYRNKIIAANILVIFGKDALCLHGASDKNYRALKAPSFLQWEQIKFAKNKGCIKYDFWGIDEKKWPGITFFKKSFNGQEFKYPKGKDFLFQKLWYKTYRAYKKFKKLSK